MWLSRLSWGRLAGPTLVFWALCGGPARAKTHAVVISVPECRSGRYALPMAEVNARRMRAALRGTLGVPEESIHELAGPAATKAALRGLLLSDLPRRLEAGDRLIVYYTGHGSLKLMSGAPVRVYFTYETSERPGEKAAGQRWYDDTVITDLELGEWLEPLRKKGVETILWRECCFNGRGYSKPLQAAAPLMEEGSTNLTPADYELSACSANQAAYAVTRKEGGADKSEEAVGAFTDALARALSQDAVLLTLGEVASFVERELRRTSPEQTPCRGGLRRDRFDGLVLLDRSRMTLVIRVEDTLTHQELKDARIFLEGFSEKGKALLSPARFEGVKRALRRAYPWVECEGYVPGNVAVELDRGASEQEVTVGLEPEVAAVKGRVTVSPGSLRADLRVAYKLEGDMPASGPAFDDEVVIGSDGSFRLRVPPRRSLAVMVLSRGRVLARKEVNDGKPLDPLRAYDVAADRWVERRPYDVGSIEVVLPRSGPTPAEAEFERYLTRGQGELEGGDLEAARDTLAIARDQVSRLPEATREASKGRVEAVIARVEQEMLSKKATSLERAARGALDGGDLDRAERVAREARDLDGELVWPGPMLKDIERRRARLAREREARSRVADRDRRTTTHRAPDRTPRGAPRSITGFTYNGKSAQGMDEYTHDRTGLVFVFIPGGTFTMGSPEGESGHEDDEREHRVTLSPYLIAKYEVTQSVWEKVMGSNPSKFKKGGNYPVERVSWNNVKEFCDKVGLELPTESQWEHACRAGTTGAYAGDLDQSGWYDNSGGSTHPVGLKAPNPWGLYDMYGNVWEWCQDWYDSDYPRGSVTDPRGPAAGSYRVRRGGSWVSYARLCRSAYRCLNDPSRTCDNLGFRPARSLR